MACRGSSSRQRHLGTRSQPAKVDAGGLSQNHTKATASNATAGIGGQGVGGRRNATPGGQRPGDFTVRPEPRPATGNRSRCPRSRRGGPEPTPCLLRQAAAAQPPRHKLLATAAAPLARALASGVAPGQAAADLGVAPSTITRALQRGAVPGAAEYLSTIRHGYEDGQERQRDCRRLLQEARGRPTA